MLMMFLFFFYTIYIYKKGVGRYRKYGVFAPFHMQHEYNLLRESKKLGIPGNSDVFFPHMFGSYQSDQYW